MRRRMHKAPGAKAAAAALCFLLMGANGCGTLPPKFFRATEEPSYDPFVVNSVAEPDNNGMFGLAPPNRKGPAGPEPPSVKGRKASAVGPGPDDPGDRVHVLKPGETLSDLAKWYLGDPLKFTEIARYNHIQNSDLVHAGRIIKIPRGRTVDSVPIPEGKTAAWEPSTLSMGEPGEDWANIASPEDPGGGSPPVEEGPTEPSDEGAGHRNLGIDLFEMGKWEEALVQFSRALSLDPQDRLAADFFCRCHIQIGKALLEKKDYLAAARHFRACLEYCSDCRECTLHAEESEESYKETHYKRGMQLFHQQRLVEAVEAWERVQAVDPHYKRVESLIQKGKIMIKRMEEIRERQG